MASYASIFPCAVLSRSLVVSWRPGSLASASPWFPPLRLWLSFVVGRPCHEGSGNFSNICSLWWFSVKDACHDVPSTWVPNLIHTCSDAAGWHEHARTRGCVCSGTFHVVPPRGSAWAELLQCTHPCHINRHWQSRWFPPCGFKRTSSSGVLIRALPPNSTWRHKHLTHEPYGRSGGGDPRHPEHLTSSLTLDT